MQEVYDLWEAYDNKKEEWLMRRPVCACCGNHIQEEYAVCFNDDLFCDACIDDMKVPIDDD